jgi:DNA-binding response OmpR family regulator
MAHSLPQETAIMDTKPGVEVVEILYIGQLDPAHEKLWEQLPREGITVEFARTQKAGLEMAGRLQPQIVIVSLLDTQFSGIRLCQALGRRLPKARRLLIAERSASIANVPCEVRLVRPFTTRKLRDTIFRLLEQSTPHLVTAGCLQLDVVSRVITGPRGKQRLTPKQCNLLTVLMQHPNQVISRKDLMDQIWETAYLGDTRTLDVHIRWLREKIELDPTAPALLLTRRGIGYVLAVPEVRSEGLDEDDLALQDAVSDDNMSRPNFAAYGDGMDAGDEDHIADSAISS